MMKVSFILRCYKHSNSMLRYRSLLSNVCHYGRMTNSVKKIGIRNIFIGCQVRSSHLEKESTTQVDPGDVFGDLAKENDYQRLSISQKMEEMDLEEDDNDHVRLSKTGRKHSPLWYGRTIERLTKEGKIAEAIDVLQVKMLKEDRVMPTPYVFTALIGALGRVGYTHKAFKLYNQMKKMGLQPEDPTYTGLFNACANSPWKDDGLKRAKHLHSQLKEKEIDMNLMTYHSLIKCYGKCGDLLLAFGVVDEMIEKGVMPSKETFSFLLMSAISDKEAGLKHAIEVWRRLRKKQGKFDIFHYNLLLRAVRECKLGDIQFSNELIKTPLITSNENDGNKDLLAIISDNNVAIKSGWWNVATDEKNMMQVNNVNNTPVLENAISVMNKDVPNLLNPSRKLREVVSLQNLDTPSSRLALLGGLPGILSHMKADGAKPDIKTFTLLLDIIPSERHAEEDLIFTMNSNKVTLDISFLNLLIRRRNLRKDKEGVEIIVSLISTLKLIPNIQTFACLAMGCGLIEDAKQLLNDMESLGIIPNAEIMNILAYQANMNFTYRLFLLKMCEKYEIQPEKLFIFRNEKAIAKARRWLIDLEKGKLKWEENEIIRFKRQFKFFMVYYSPWLKRTGVSLEKHPWEQYYSKSNHQEEITE